MKLNSQNYIPLNGLLLWLTVISTLGWIATLGYSWWFEIPLPSPVLLLMMVQEFNSLIFYISSTRRHRQ